MTTTRYRSGERPRIRFKDESKFSGWPLSLVAINSRTAYFRSAWAVGEMACNAEDVEIITHADGTPVTELEPWPPE